MSKPSLPGMVSVVPAGRMLKITSLGRNAALPAGCQGLAGDLPFSQNRCSLVPNGSVTPIVGRESYLSFLGIMTTSRSTPCLVRYLTGISVECALARAVVMLRSLYHGF